MWSRDMGDTTMKSIANRFIAECQAYNLSYAETQTLLTSLQLRLKDKLGKAQVDAANEAWARKAEIKMY